MGVFLSVTAFGGRAFPVVLLMLHGRLMLSLLAMATLLKVGRQCSALQADGYKDILLFKI
jgi:hypothetical protein